MEQDKTRLVQHVLSCAAGIPGGEIRIEGASLKWRIVEATPTAEAVLRLDAAKEGHWTESIKEQYTFYMTVARIVDDMESRPRFYVRMTLIATQQAGLRAGDFIGDDIRLKLDGEEIWIRSDVSRDQVPRYPDRGIEWIPMDADIVGPLSKANKAHGRVGEYGFEVGRAGLELLGNLTVGR